MSQQCSRARAIVALSGGVDSSVAAALLLEQGYDVEGATLLVWQSPRLGDAVAGPAESVERARAVAGKLGIRWHGVDVRDEFEAKIVGYFVAEYSAGRTPNPCVLCNQVIKFGLLLGHARELGAGYLATGHYARVRKLASRYQLLRGTDTHKDQSYFLHTLTQGQLAQVRFPLGELTKQSVREIARQRGLPTAALPESQDVCFLAGSDHRSFLAERAPQLFRPGPIRDTAGRIVGQHSGLPGYTVGQRKGLGIASNAPLYVVALEPAQNELVIGPAEALGWSECLIEQWHMISGETVTAPFEASAQIRYRARPVRVSVTPLAPSRARVQFAAIQRDITPGQFLVLYDGDVVLGGGVIDAPVVSEEKDTPNCRQR